MKPLLILHGAIGSEEQVLPIKDSLATEYRVYTLNFSGHGGKPMQSEFSIQQFAKEVLEWIKEMKLEKISIFGYSMGGYVALYLAKTHPGIIESVVTLGTKLHWDAQAADKEGSMLQPDVIERKVPKFAEQLSKIHHPGNWKILLQLTADMLQQMASDNPVSKEDFRNITAKVLLIVGDRDKTATLDETIEAYRMFPSAQLAVLPGTPHAIEQVDVESVKGIIMKFLD